MNELWMTILYIFQVKKSLIIYWFIDLGFLSPRFSIYTALI